MHGIAGVGATFSARPFVYSPVPCAVLGARFGGREGTGETIRRDGLLDVDMPDAPRAYGRFIYVDRACVDQVSIALVATSPAGQAALPVPRERDWRSGPTELLGASFSYRNLVVPAAPGLRYWALLTETDNETQQIFAPAPMP